MALISGHAGCGLNLAPVYHRFHFGVISSLPVAKFTPARQKVLLCGVLIGGLF